MTADTAAPSLKPCPFCGEPPDVTETGWTTTIHCGNESCGCDVEATGTERHVVAEAWNTRATPPAPTPSAGMAEALYEFVRSRGIHGPNAKPWTERSDEHKQLWRDAILALLPDAAAIRADDVQDTYLVGGADLKAMSGDIDSNRVIKLHFRRRVTDKDREWLLEAINLKIKADQDAAAIGPRTILSSDCVDPDIEAAIRAAAFEEAAKIAENIEQRDAAFQVAYIKAGKPEDAAEHCYGRVVASRVAAAIRAAGEK